MYSLSTELKHTIKRRLDVATPAEIMAITSTLCAQEVPVPAIAPRQPGDARSAGPRFSKIDAGGYFEGDIDDWAAVHDKTTGLFWTRNTIGAGRMNWADAMKAAGEISLLGCTDWRLPTIRELLTLVDYDRHEPAIDTDFFQCESAWYWSSTPAANSPSDCAWAVYFSGGLADWGDRDGYGYVRAVRAGQ